VLAREPDGVAHRLVLGEANVDERGDYVVMTNFDFYWHDVREYFDPTSGCVPALHPETCPTRRVNAEAVLDGTRAGALSPATLFAAIDSPGTFAPDGTIFQATIDVAAGLWNVSQPPLS